MRIPYSTIPEHYLHYYHQQVGSGLPYFSGPLYQRGGGFFSNLFSRITPLFPSWLKSGAALVGREALKTGLDIVGDAARAESADHWKQKAMQRLRSGGGEILKGIGEKLQKGEGIKASHRKRRRKLKAITVKRTKRDFFDQK